MKSSVNTIIDLAQVVARERGASFFAKLGPGKEKGNGVTDAFMHTLRQLVRENIGEGFDERRICGNTKFSVDFYIPNEMAVVEIELSARNPHTNFERDVFKCLLATDAGNPVEKLVILGKPGTLKRLSMPDHLAIRAWLKRNHKIEVEVAEISISD